MNNFSPFFLLILFFGIFGFGLATSSHAQNRFLSQQERGNDICASGDYFYIIRSDLRKIARVSDMKTGEGYRELDMNPEHIDGDHYLANSNYFYIIKGNAFSRASSLSKEAEETWSLHKDCRGASHYFATDEYFYFIKGKSYYRTTSLNKANDIRVFTMAKGSEGGSYYFAKANENKFYLTRPSDYHYYYRTSNLNEFSSIAKYFISVEVLDFMDTPKADKN